MKQSKTVLKLESKLILVSEDLNKLLSQDFTEFDSLSYSVKFDHFPGSLLFTCIFENTEEFLTIKTNEKRYQVKLHQLLFRKGIVLKNASHNLRFIIKENNA